MQLIKKVCRNICSVSIISADTSHVNVYENNCLAKIKGPSPRHQVKDTILLKLLKRQTLKSAPQSARELHQELRIPKYRLFCTSNLSTTSYTAKSNNPVNLLSYRYISLNSQNIIQRELAAIRYILRLHTKLRYPHYATHCYWQKYRKSTLLQVRFSESPRHNPVKVYKNLINPAVSCRTGASL